MLAIAKAARGNYATALSTLAFASYLSLHPILLLPPMVLLSFDQYAIKTKKPYNLLRHVLKSVVIFGMSLLAFLWLSFQLTGSWEFLESTYGVRLLLPDLTPNIGLWWYFFVEIFDPFRSFYLGVFWLHLASYTFGLTIRLRNRPLFAVVALIGLCAIFQPYPSIADANLYLSLLPLYRHLFPCKSSCIFRKSLTKFTSDALFIHCGNGHTIFDCPRSGVLLSMDLCWQRKCKFFLRHHTRLESRADSNHSRFFICSSQRGMGGRKAGDGRPRC